MGNKALLLWKEALPGCIALPDTHSAWTLSNLGVGDRQLRGRCPRSAEVADTVWAILVLVSEALSSGEGSYLSEALGWGPTHAP